MHDPARAQLRRGDHELHYPLARDGALPIIHVHLRSVMPSSPSILKAPNPTTPALRKPQSFYIVSEERVLQDILSGRVLAQGVWITRSRRLRGQELVELGPSIRLAVTATLSHKECKCSAGVIKAAVTKVLAKRK